MAGKVGFEILEKLAFLGRTRPFSPFDLDELETVLHQGISLLETFGDENPDANLEVLENKWTKMRGLYDQRVRLTEIDLQLEQEYKNAHDLDLQNLNELLSTLWRANIITALLLSLIHI